MKRLATSFLGALLLFPTAILAQEGQAKKTPVSKPSTVKPKQVDAKKAAAKKASPATKNSAKPAAKKRKSGKTSKSTNGKRKVKRPVAVAQAMKPIVRKKTHSKASE